MSMSSVITRGFSNGTFTADTASVITRGYEQGTITIVTTGSASTITTAISRLISDKITATRKGG